MVILTSATLLLFTEFSENSAILNPTKSDGSGKDENIVDDLMYGAKFWLCVHVGCGLALSLHTREIQIKGFHSPIDFFILTHFRWLYFYLQGKTRY